MIQELLPDFDDHLALGASCFDIGQSFIGRFKREDPVDDRSDRSGFRSDMILAS